MISDIKLILIVVSMYAMFLFVCIAQSRFITKYVHPTHGAYKVVLSDSDIAYYYKIERN